MRVQVALGGGLLVMSTNSTKTHREVDGRTWMQKGVTAVFVHPTRSRHLLYIPTSKKVDIMGHEPVANNEPCAEGGLCLFEDGVLVRTDDGCPTHSKRPRGR